MPEIAEPWRWHSPCWRCYMKQKRGGWRNTLALLLPCPPLFYQCLLLAEPHRQLVRSMSRSGPNWYSQLWPSWAWTENFQLTYASQENQRALCTSSRDLISLNFIPESWDNSNWHGSNSLRCFVERILKLSWAQKQWVLLSFSNVYHGWASREWWHRCHTG